MHIEQNAPFLQLLPTNTPSPSHTPTTTHEFIWAYLTQLPPSTSHQGSNQKAKKHASLNIQFQRDSIL